MESFFSIIFAPIKQFLMDQGIWEPLVELYATVVALLEKVMAWLGVQAPDGSGVGGFLLAALKLAAQIFITLINVLIDIGKWIMNLF